MAQQVSQNTFIRGLQMDTSPMQLDSATLSNALNATLVTMNGNEVILLNDMGNARVDNAYLPSGYVPIGMKEYGGVIYVAAYNPITNKGQVGSFPSPERRFGSEYEGLISGEVDIKNFFNTDINKENVRKVFNLNNGDTYDNVKNAINYDIILVPLIKEIKLEGWEKAKETENTNIIRAGDKFSIYDGDKIIYGENGKGINEYLSNYDNTLWDNQRAYALKNNILTFSVGILNSQNEFVDITPTLKRFDSSGNLLDLDEASNVYKFNRGYFISKEGPETGTSPGTIDDKILIAEREKMAVNTYGQKLVGPMYLKMELNTIKQFSYAIEGYKTKEGGYKLLLYSYYKYNFPDGFYKNLPLTDFLKEYYINCLKCGYPLGSEPRPMSQNYEKAYGPLTYYLFNNLLPTNEIKKGQSELLNGNNELLYNELEKLYSTVTKTTIDIETNEEKIEYKLLPGMTFGGMKNLEVTGILDLNKLGSGDFELNHWRYYNANNTLTLTYGWNSYPIPGSRISDISFTFYDTSDSDNIGKIEPSYLLDYRESYNGVFTESFEYNQLGLEEKKLYLVEIKAKRTWDDGTLAPKYLAYYDDSSNTFTLSLLEKTDAYYEFKGKVLDDEDLKFYILSENIETGKEYEIYSKLGPVPIPILGSGSTVKISFTQTRDDIYTEYRFVLTTELFNDCYFYNSENFIKDYGKPKNESGTIYPALDGDSPENYTEEALIYRNKLKVSLDLDLSYDDYTTSTTKQFGNLAKKAVGSDNQLTYGYTTKYDINCKLNYNLHLENPDYYPFKMDDITTGATYELETIEQSNNGPNNIAPYTGEDTGGTNESVRPEPFTDPTLFDLGGHLVVGGGSSSNHSNPTVDDNLGETSSSEGSEEQTNVTDISKYFEIKLSNTVENILKKEGSENPNFTDPDDFYNCDIRFENGLIYGYLNVIQKCKAKGSKSVINVKNAFKSIYDHLDKIFSMYDGHLYGFVIGNGNTNDPHKYLMSITNAPVNEVEYFNAENDNTGSKRGCKYKPNPTTEDRDWQSNPSYIIQFKSWKDLSKVNERESIPYVSFISDSNGNSDNHYFELSKISGGIVDIWKQWNSDDGNYSLVGMINAESLVNEKRKWNDATPYYDFKLSNQTLYCRIWWKTTDDRYVLFPIMWCNRFVGKDHPYDPASNSVTLECNSSTADIHPSYPGVRLGFPASRYKYNTPLNDSIGEFDDKDNIFRNTLNSFYFTLGEETSIEMFITDSTYTYASPYYVILKLFGYIKFAISNIPYEDFYNNLESYLLNYFNGKQIEKELFNFHGIGNEYERSLNDLFEKHYNSPDKIDLLISESLELKNQNELIMDISGGRISDSEGRPLVMSRFYIENENKELEVNTSLGNYFNIDLERKLILLEEKAFTYKNPKYFITCGAEESINGNNKSGKRVKAIFDKKCVAVMDLNYPIFKQLDEDALKAKNWEQV